MIRTARLTIPVRLDRDDLRRSLLTLQKSGWVPAILESELQFSKLAGVEDTTSLRLPSSSALVWKTSSTVEGDVFFRDREVYYFISRSEGQSDGMIVTWGLSPGSRREEPEPAGLEVGLVTDSGDDLELHVRLFAEEVQRAILAAVDGRKTRHMTFNWAPPQPRQTRLAQFRTPAEEGAAVRLEHARLERESVVGSQALSTASAREVLRLLSQSGFALERDILSGRLRRHDDLTAVLGEFKRAELIVPEYLLECKKGGAPLARLGSERLEAPGAGDLICTACGARFAEETISKGYTVSPLGHSLLQHSRWMTVWLTEKLIKLGVPIDSILWNLAELGEEVDLVVEFLGQLWIFELKDREFGTGDAYPFNFRRQRYRPDKAFVVTTDKVSRDAKRVFEDPAKDGLERRDTGPVFIEGLDSAEQVLQREITIAAFRYGSDAVATLGMMMGYDLLAVLAARFGYRLEYAYSADVRA